MFSKTKRTHRPLNDRQALPVLSDDIIEAQDRQREACEESRRDMKNRGAIAASQQGSSIALDWIRRVEERDGIEYGELIVNSKSENACSATATC